MKSLTSLGIMSGTSLDGVDFVLSKWTSHFEGRYLGFASLNFPKELRKRLLKSAEGKMSVRDLARLHHELGRFYASSTTKVMKSKSWKPDVIGLHGQTIFHEAPGTTLQIGEASYLANESGLPVVTDFRVADLAAGGQGAPLATFFHAVVLKKHILKGPCAFHNLGGISNVSYFPKGKLNLNSLSRQPLHNPALSFDTGPANMLIDAFMAHLGQSFDPKGRLAAAGLVDFHKLERFLRRDSFFNQAPPKSCGREQYGEAYLSKLLQQLRGHSRADIAATLTEYTALTIAESYKRYLPKLPQLAVFSGGGTRNDHLMFRIRFHLPHVRVVTSDEIGWPSQAVEGGAFGALAAARFWKAYGHLPQTTGAREPVLLGKIVQTKI